ncbi:hypothetical protein [Phenylobacterium sp.]|uniref:hypothetical protein n=1 Tax=Phenylobacterium sp. TaxID=1871053 RepID=UPI0035B1A349
MTEMKCPIWGSRALLKAGRTDGDAHVHSWRTGGDYRINAYARTIVAGLPAKDKAKLTTWLVDQRRAGESVPLIGEDVARAAKDQPPLNFSERRRRLFLGLAAMNYMPGQILSASFYEDASWPELLSAWTECSEDGEIGSLMDLLADDGLLTAEPNRRLTGRGVERMEAVVTGGADTRQAFVAMWFGEEMDEAWRLGFAPGVRDAGYKPLRIDGKEHNNKIDDEIVAEIKRSRFLIADFTCGGVEVDGKFEPNPRGGVYYEAGLAHGLGMEVIFTCRADRMDYAHFDTRQFAHIVWREPTDLRAALYNRIAATLKEAPGAPGRGQGTVSPAP